ncbi:MAG TPA: CDP-alcohol phosphatidyltransferase family protein [Actinomycetota bacterium]|nr:CDP-alcohol phosphatidyltransferase family protein [Actinomycetota bacterium]
MSATPMLKRLFGAALQRVVLPLGAVIGRAGVTPNMITVTGFVLTVLAAVVVSEGRFLLGGLILTGGSLLDMLDGAVARATGKGSKAGAFLDSTLDRLSDAVVFVGLIWWFTHGFDWALAPTDAAEVFEPSMTNQLGAGLALAGLILSLMVSYVRARAEGLGFTCNVGIAERPERIFLVAGGLILDVVIPALVILVAVTAITVVQRFLYVWRQAKVPL